jgi:hypothetical protein
MDSDNVLNIVKYLIRSTPYGHLKETLENLKNLVGPNIIDEKEIQDEITLYEEDHLRQVSLNEDKIIISKYNKDEEGFYHDQGRKIKIQINPLSENIEKINDLEDDSNFEFRNLLEKALREYVSKCYKSGITASNSKNYFKIIFYLILSYPIFALFSLF